MSSHSTPESLALIIRPHRENPAQKVFADSALLRNILSYLITTSPLSQLESEAQSYKGSKPEVLKLLHRIDQYLRRETFVPMVKTIEKDAAFFSLINKTAKTATRETLYDLAHKHERLESLGMAQWARLRADLIAEKKATLEREISALEQDLLTGIPALLFTLMRLPCALINDARRFPHHHHYIRSSCQNPHHNSAERMRSLFTSRVLSGTLLSFLIALIAAQPSYNTPKLSPIGALLVGLGTTILPLIPFLLTLRALDAYTPEAELKLSPVHRLANYLSDQAQDLPDVPRPALFLLALTTLCAIFGTSEALLFILLLSSDPFSSHHESTVPDRFLTTPAESFSTALVVSGDKSSRPPRDRADSMPELETEDFAEETAQL